jgi:hypothetical protein
MGNQQLLLLTLGMLIVGVAISVGIIELRAYNSEVTADNIQSHLLTLARDAVVFYEKPKSLGGGDRSWVDYNLSKKTLNCEGATVEMWVSQVTVAFHASGPVAADKIVLNVTVNAEGKYLVLWNAEGKFADRNRTEWAPL